MLGLGPQSHPPRSILCAGGRVAGTQPCHRKRKAETVLPPSEVAATALTAPSRHPLAPPERDPESPQPQAEVRVGRIMATLADLPDSVLLEIFSYLPVRDRIRISRCGPAPRGGWKGRVGVGLTLRCGSGPRGAGVVLTAGPLPQGLSPMEEAGGRPVALATCRPDAVHGTRGRRGGPGPRSGVWAASPTPSLPGFRAWQFRALPRTVTYLSCLYYLLMSFPGEIIFQIQLNFQNLFPE